MEIHHPHHPTHKKKWTEYLLEFVMLFLAVFLGFLAENKREHIVNTRKEKYYMQSMVEDLQKDTATFRRIIQRSEVMVKNLDTMTQTLLSGVLNDSSIKQLYRLNLSTLSSNQTSLTDRTSTQLKNAGGLQLIRNSAVVKVLFDYWTAAIEIENNAGNYNELRQNAREKTYGIFSAKYYSATPDGNRFNKSSNPVLMNSDPFVLTELANRLNHLKNSYQFVYIPHLKSESAAAVQLIELIRKKYHLKE